MGIPVRSNFFGVQGGVSLRDQFSTRGWLATAAGVAAAGLMFWEFHGTPWTAISFAIPATIFAICVVWYFPGGHRFPE